MLTGAQHLQNIHPLIVHFPIAFLIGAALFYFLASVFKKEEFARTGFWILLLGALSLVVSVGTGLYAQQGVMVALDVREELLEPHEQFMITTAILCTIAILWAFIGRPLPKKGRILFLGLLFAMVIVMTIGADYGGRLVYEYNAGGSACPQPIHYRK